MKAKFEKGDIVKIVNHPVAKFIGQSVEIVSVQKGRFREKVGFVDHYVYRVKNKSIILGWANEADLEK